MQEKKKWEEIMADFMIRVFKVDSKYAQTISTFIKSTEKDFRKAYSNTLALNYQTRFGELKNCTSDAEIKRKLQELLELGLDKRGIRKGNEKGGYGGKRMQAGKPNLADTGEQKNTYDERAQLNGNVNVTNRTENETAGAEKDQTDAGIEGEQTRKKTKQKDPYTQYLVDFIQRIFPKKRGFDEFIEEYVQKNILLFKKNYPTEEKLISAQHEFAKLQTCATKSQLAAELGKMLDSKPVKIEEPAEKKTEPEKIMNKEQYKNYLIDFIKKIFPKERNYDKFITDYVGKYQHRFESKYPDVAELKKAENKFNELSTCKSEAELQKGLNELLGFNVVKKSDLEKRYRDLIKNRVGKPDLEDKINQVVKEYLRQINNKYKGPKMLTQGLDKGDFDKCKDCKTEEDVRKVFEQILELGNKESERPDEGDWTNTLKDQLMKRCDLKPEFEPTIEDFVKRNSELLKKSYTKPEEFWERSNLNRLADAKNTKELQESLDDLIQPEIGKTQKVKTPDQKQEVKIINYGVMKDDPRGKTKKFFREQMSIALSGTKSNYLDIDVTDLYNEPNIETSGKPIQKYERLPKDYEKTGIRIEDLKEEIGGKEYQKKGRLYYLWGEMIQLLAEAINSEPDETERKKRVKLILSNLRKFSIDLNVEEWKPLSEQDLKKLSRLVKNEVTENIGFDENTPVKQRIKKWNKHNRDRGWTKK